MNNKILIYNSGGGLGDSIQLIPIILSIQNTFKNYEIFYISAHDNHYNGKLKEYNINVNNLKIDIKYFGFRWWHLFVVKKKFFELQMNKFDLIIDLQSKLRNTLILKKIPTLKFYSSTFNFLFCTSGNSYLKNSNLCKMTLTNIEKILDKKINYTPYDIALLPEIYKKEAKRLLPNKNYIGFSVTQGNVYRKKSWPLKNFIDVANKISKKNKIPVFFIEKNQNHIIEEIKFNVPKALFPEMESNLSCPALVTALASKLEEAVSIDNGIMHMIALTNIPMTILFGPTNSEKFAPRGKKINIIDSKVLYKSNDINKITVEDVLEKFNF